MLSRPKEVVRRSKRRIDDERELRVRHRARVISENRFVGDGELDVRACKTDFVAPASSVAMRAVRSSASDSALIGSSIDRARSRTTSTLFATLGPESAATGIDLFDDGGAGGAPGRFEGNGGGGFFGSGGLLTRGSGSADAFFAAGGGSGGGIDFFSAAEAAAEWKISGAGASSFALGNIISDVGIFIIFEGGSPDATCSVRTCSSMSQPSSVIARSLSIEFLSSSSMLFESAATGTLGSGGGGFDGREIDGGAGFGSGGGREDFAGMRVRWCHRPAQNC